MVTYKERSILYDKAIYAPLDKQFVTRVIVNELAHMWLGDLVTMKWWDSLWVVEGWARLMEARALDAIPQGAFRMVSHNMSLSLSVVKLFQNEYFMIMAQNPSMNTDSRAIS